jgi:hypothetical protein
MISQFPGSPLLLRGALVVYASYNPGAKAEVISFQYNPEQLTRSLSQATAGSTADSGTSSRGQAQEDLLRVPGPPIEAINLSIVLDAADQLEDPITNPITVVEGLYPTLAKLELLLYPTSAQVQDNETRALSGQQQAHPPNLPLTLLVWGRSRVVPVKITNFAVTEEAFDTQLNPIRLKVELSLRVLTYRELPASSIGRDIYLAYFNRKEQQAAMYGFGSNILRDASIRLLLPR